MAASIQRLAVQALRTFSSNRCGVHFRERLLELKEAMRNISLRDLNIDESLLAVAETESSSGSGLARCVAPVTYIQVWEDRVMSMGVFIIKRDSSIPLHDHPNMHGLIKIIHGTASIQTYNHNNVVNNNGDDTGESSGSDSIAGASGSSKIVSSHHKKPTYQIDVLSSTEPPDASIDGLPLGCTIDVVKNPPSTITSEGDVCLLTPSECNFHEIKASQGTVAFLDILAPPYDHDTLSRVCHYYREVSLPEAPRVNMCRLSHIDQPEEFWCDSVPYEGPTIEWHGDDE